MFNTKIKYLPSRPGDRYGSTFKNNNAQKILSYKPKKKKEDYIKKFISKL